MMAEYIEREYLLYEFREIIPEMGVDELADEIYDIALNVEAADVVPAKHGKWIFDAENYEWNCSECHNWPIDGSADDEKTYYCPHCGARMDAKKEG